MPARTAKAAKTARKKEPTKASGRLEIIFGGPLLFVPKIEENLITEVEVFFPKNGHPAGAVFLPGKSFSTGELDGVGCEDWPDPESFTMLDPHSYAIDLVQGGKGKPMRSSEIPATNHKIKPGRRLSDAWEIAVTIRGRLSGWSSHRHSRVTADLYTGGDIPLSETIAAMHKLTYESVASAEFYGASANPRSYFRENVAQGGSLILLGEVPYQATLLHERRAIDALAQLAGLDLHLADIAPEPHRTRLMAHTINCGHSVVVAPD